MTYVHNSRLRKMQEQPDEPRRKGTTSTDERKDELKTRITLPSMTIQRTASPGTVRSVKA